MAIKIRRPTFYKPSAVKEFTDRTEPRKAFWNRYAKMVDEGSTVITFYGAGGVGKTALLKKLEDEIKHRDKLTGNECKYVKYDFKISTDSREVLKTFKFQLSAYGCEFPLFDAGNYYYSLKVGQNVTPLKARSMLKKIPWINQIKENLSKVNKTFGKVSPLLNTAKLFFEMTDEVFKAIPVTRAITTCFSIVDALLVEYMELKKILDEDHQALRNQINACLQKKNPVELYELLPMLFATDVADWMKATGNKLVVLLDNYESLAGATTLATDEQKDS